MFWANRESCKWICLNVVWGVKVKGRNYTGSMHYLNPTKIGSYVLVILLKHEQFHR